MSYSQDKRPLAVQTPLGKDKLFLIGFSGQEAISRLFTFRLETLAENKTDVRFDKLLGQKVTVDVELTDKKKRYFNGIVSRVIEGNRGSTFTEYALEIVPRFWLLTRKSQSRIFQHKSVPDILKEVLSSVDPSYELRGTFNKREYCVQYRESDFSFASRLMEEEGIFYFFKHSDGDHKMVVANSSDSHPEVPGSKAIYESLDGGLRNEDRVHTWVKAQELRSGKVTVWDHKFQLPHKHLEAQKPILDSVQAGTVTHKLNVADNSRLELYDYPGAYAKRYDGISGGGGEQPEELQKIFQDNQHMADTRMQEEAAPSIVIEGTSYCRQFTSGHKFTLQRHFNADGAYVITSLWHLASCDNYRTDGSIFSYGNGFSCAPLALPFRPARVTRRPTVLGTQTAVVAGPGGEEIFTDKYGRVKVQFHWDRDGKNNADSSCWLRVATYWAGKQWGSVHIPRIGQEVIVDFLEGDPDRPIIVGSVYNAEQMPPYDLPANKTQSGIKSRSSLGGSPANFNEIRFEDKMGSEQLYIHAEKNEDIVVEHDKTEQVGNNETIQIGNNRTEQVGNNQSITVSNSDTLTVVNNQSITIGISQSETIGAERTATIGAEDSLEVGGARTAEIGGADSLSVGGAIIQEAGGAISITAGGLIAITASAAVTITSSASIAITAPAVLINGRPVAPTPGVPI